MSRCGCLRATPPAGLPWNTEKAERLLWEESQGETLDPPAPAPTPGWKAASHPAPTVLAWLSEPGNAPLCTPTDTRPARHRSPQVPTPPGAPHPLSPRFPQKLFRAHVASHTCSPWAALWWCRPVTTHLSHGLVGAWAFLPETLTCGHTAPLHVSFPDPLPQWPTGPPGSGHFPGLPGLHAHSPAQPSPSWHPKGKKRKSR